MRFADVITTALQQIRVNKLRSFFTLLGIIVSVAFLVAVVAIISGMNAYVKENLASALIGANTFQVRRTPIRIGLFDDEEWRRLQRRPRLTESDAEAVMAAVPEAVAVSMQIGSAVRVLEIVHRDVHATLREVFRAGQPALVGAGAIGQRRGGEHDQPEHRRQRNDGDHEHQRDAAATQAKMLQAASHRSVPRATSSRCAM